MNDNNFMIRLQALLDKVKSIANIKSDIKSIESKLPKIKIQGMLDSAKTKKELNTRLKSIKTKVIVDADVSRAEKNIKKIGNRKTTTVIRPTIDNSQAMSSLKATQKETKGLFDRFLNGVVGINLVRMSVQKVTQAIYQAISGVKELDKIKTNIQMVSGASNSGVDAMMNSYNAMAKDLSSTTKSVAEAANEFLRMGESVSSTNELIKSSQVLSKVGMIESSDAASYLISSLKGYKVAAEDSMDIVSKLTSVDLEAAVSAGGLAEALSKCSNIADNSGVSMDRLVGYTATVGEVTQKSMSEVGNSFQSIFSRMNNIKINRFIDDDTGESLSDTESVLDKLGIKLRDTEDTYRSFDDVLDDIGSRWESFTKVEKNAISVAIAGTRQRENFEALMNNWGNALKYSETAANSAGSALERYGVYQDSIEAKTNKLTAAIESLSTNTISEGMFSGIIEATTNIVEFIDKTNLLKGTLAGLVTLGISKVFVSMASGIVTAYKSTAQLTNVMALFNKGTSVSNLENIGKACIGLSDRQLKLVLSTKGLAYEQQKQILLSKGVAESEVEATLATLGFANAENAATASTFSLSGAFNTLKTAIVSNPIGIIVTTVSIATMVFSTFNDSVEEATNKTKELADEALNEEENIESLIKQYNELDKTDRSTDNTETIKNLNNEINEALGNQADNIDLVNGKLDEQSDKLKRNLLLKLQDDQGGIDANVAATSTEYEKGISFGTFGNDTSGNVAKALYEAGIDKWYKNSFYSGIDGKLNSMGADEQLVQLKEWRDSLTEKYKETGNYGDEVNLLNKWYNELDKKREERDKALQDQQLRDEKERILSDWDSGQIGNAEAFKAYREEIRETYKENSVLQNQMLDFIDNLFPDFAKKLQETRQTTSSEVSPTLSFSEAWKAIGTSGNEKADKAANEAKEKLLELAEAGKLTVEAFNNSPIAENFLKDTKLSAEEATQKINGLISSADQLSSMKTGISSISNILGEKKENQSSKKTRTKGIGADTLAGMPDDIKAQTKEYEHFVEVLGDGTSSMDECKEAANKLATAYVNSNNFLSNLTKENKDYYKSVLKEMGVENAAEVVKAALNKQKVNAKIATFDMKNATEQEISTLGSYVKSLDDSSKALAYYTLQQQIANNNALDTSDSVKNLMNLAKQCGITGEAISLMTSLAADMKTVEYYTTGDGKNDRNAGDIVSNANYEVNGNKNRLNKIIKKGVKVGTASPKVTPKDSSGSKGKSKKGKSDKSKSKQQFDWISRALDRLSSKLDLVKSKYDNLFTSKKIKNSDSLLKQQNKNLDKQYKLLQKTEKYQKKAQKKYTNKANSIKLDASLKKAVREGRIKGRMKQLIATYGEKKAEKIQKYQDWYDKSQEQKKNRITTQTSKRENRIQKYQNIVDNADEKRSLAQAGKENATTAKDKNAFIEKEKESIETSYEYQIRIARLKKDSLEADRLIAEKAKEIRDLTIEHHQNLADEHQSVLDQYNAEKELATKASEKNGLIEREKAKTQELYTEKIAIAGLEGNISEQKQLQAELDKQLRDFSVEQHQNLADEYQAELDKSSAEKENLYTAGEKNAVVDREKNLTSQLYAEKIAIARIEGRISEELQLQEELTRQMVVLEKEKFDNISHYYENLMRLENNAYTDLKNASEELETRGLIVSGKLYNSQIAINNSKKKMYEDELLSLNNQLHSIKEGTDEWYESMDAIQSCENGIAELTKDTLALAEASRKVSFTLSDKILSRFDLISSEYDLLIKFMSDHKLTTDKTGNFTEEGTATLGAYYTQLLLAEKETVTFKQSLTDMYDKLQRGEEGYTDQKAWDEYYEHMEKSFQLEEKYYDIRQNMIGLMKEKYNTELDFLQDIINKRKELLQAEKDEYDYRNTIEEKTKNIGVLAKQLQALNGDDSEAARSRIQQLKVNLDEAQKDLQDTEYDKWLSDQQTMLDNLYNEYHDFIDDKLNDTDALFNEAVTYLKDINVGAEVSEVLKSYGETYDHTYTPYFENINTALGKEGDIVKAITNTSDLISEHFNKQAVTTQEAGDVIRLISEIGQVDYDGDGRKRLVAAEQAYNSLSQEAKTIVDTTSVNGLTTLQQKQSEWLGLSEARKQEEEHVRQQQEEERVLQQKEEMKKKLDYYIADTYGRDGRTYACNLQNASPADIGIAEAIKNHKLRRVDGWNSPNQTAINEIVSRINSEGTGVNIPATADGLWMYMQNIGYSNGGIAETLQKVPGMNGDDGWVTVKKGEGIFTPEQTQQFIKLVSNVDTLNPALDAVKSLSKSEYEPVPNRITNQSVGEVNIEMNLPNVTNYEEFRRKMQSDPKIEKMFKSMVWDKGDFSKYRIRM